MTLAFKGCTEDHVEELEALQSIFCDDVIVLEEVPIKFEVSIPIDLPCKKRIFASRIAAQQEVPVPGLSGASHNEIGGQTDEKQLGDIKRNSAVFVPAAVLFAEQLLEERGVTTCMPELDQSSSGTAGSVVSVDFLPPLRLTVTFCQEYPAQRAPDFTLSALWLSSSQLAALCAELDSLATEKLGEPIVFEWVSWLHMHSMAHLALDDDAVIHLQVSEYDLDSRALSDMYHPEQALQALVEFDRARALWAWQQTAHLCEICFSEKPGTSFTKLGGCDHAFCTECLSEMLKVHIADGSVTAIRCPKPGCGCEAAPSAVQLLVDDGPFRRWHRLQVQKILSEQPGLVFCPACESRGCETPVLSDTTQEMGELPLAKCDRCEYSFCAACREAYHPHTQCVAQLHRLERLGLQQAVMNAAEKSRKQRLAEELQSLKLILAESVPCPKCKMPIVRTQGCNHMVCANCRTHFCYRCGDDITEVGYGHFRADKCPTFDRAEVERMRDGAFADGMGQDALEQELEELRRQFPEQANMVWNFRPPPGAWRRHQRRRAPGDAKCPQCGQWNPRVGTNNHSRCRICKANFCFACRTLIRGVISQHFKSGGCPQHSNSGT